MMRRALTFMGTCCVVAGAATNAWADNPHFKTGSPTFADLGLRLSQQVKLAGLGNEDLVVRLQATGRPTAVCANPGGGNQAPGQNPADVSVDSGFVSIPSTQIKNGNVTFELTTAGAPSTIEGAPDCPNPRWTEIVTGVAFTHATLTVQQGGQQVHLAGSTCTFDPPTSDGTVAAVTVSCR